MGEPEEATDFYYAMLCKILTIIGGGLYSKYHILVVNSNFKAYIK